MKSWIWRRSVWLTMASSGSLLALQGCRLSDRELASVLQSVMTSGLTSLVQRLIETAIPA
jgi:hypothetical protein